ncbi:NapC/NirT family cytochrome c [Necropsobacter massiliensis]|uniref:NapC/NirT family cytochrome c n=1 Tax=Necropsobacter massiliensis TaxID=1400001 RepID=UPI0005962309|nr:NapC/NirT family cytochrome c [Necropsobacter massiliensis]
MAKKFKKKAILGGLVLMLIGAGLWGGAQYAMKTTNATEFCVSCHSMSYPKQEWEGSVHFSNRKGIRAQCADCHVPSQGWHYFKAKLLAVKDVWYEWQGKISEQDDFEKHRAQMAQTVWAQMKATDSAACKSCHDPDAMILSEQSQAAQKMHKLASETNQTCIDCHKGLVHFMPDTQADNATAGDELAKHGGQFAADDKTLYALMMSAATLADGGEVRLMPYAELTDWKVDGDQLTATVQGWQQSGAETVVYAGLGKRLMVALLDDGTKDKVTLVRTVYDDVTASDWKQVSFTVRLPKAKTAANLTALNQYGKNLNENYCGGCHAPIGADHYTANQWIGVVNSMKDRTSMSAEEVRSLTIYLQRNAKDMAAMAR